MKKKRHLLILAALALIVSGAMMLHPFARQVVFGPNANDAVPGEQIVQGNALIDYATNPEKADKKYGGKKVIISGEVYSIRDIVDGHKVCFRAPGSPWGICCVYCFGLSELDKVHTGDSVKIKGTSKYLSQTWYGEVSSLTIEPLPPTHRM